MNPILLDTHAAIWAVAGVLPPAAMKIVEAAAERGELLLSPISAWEIGILISKKRLSITSTVHDYVRAMFNQSGVVLAAFTPAIAVAATCLPGSCHGDPADRMLIATAAAYGATFVTRDKKIQNYAKSTQYVRCIGF